VTPDACSLEYTPPRPLNLPRVLGVWLPSRAAQWVEVDDPELAYRRSCGINVKRYNGTLPVNELSRGLNTLVFVPWEDVHDHVLNLSTDKMDFFVTG